MVTLQARFLAGSVGAMVLLDVLGLTTVSPSTVAAPGLALAAPMKRPFKRASGAKRSGVCLKKTAQPLEELMAFLPDSGNSPNLTVTKAPAFYFYVPDDSANVASLEFRLDYASVARRGSGVINPPLNVPIAKTPGLVKVQLPEVLEKDTTYAWAFTLRCQGTRETVTFKGLVMHKDLEAAVASQITKANSAKDKAAIYAQTGFDLDAMPILMEGGQLQTKRFEEILVESGFEKPIE
jgi:Domain of Unknown Function (DUF928)